MKIKVINPNTSPEMTNSIHQAAIKHSRPDTQIVTVCPEMGPISIENFHDQIYAGIGLVTEVRKGVKDGFDAFVVAAACDPGIQAAKELAEAPVIGMAEAGIYMASLVAEKFSIITVLPKIKPLIEGALKRTGLSDRCLSIRTTNLCVLDCEDKPDLVKKELSREARLALEADGAEAIWLGCAGMASFADDLEKEIGVPVLDGVVCAVKMAEALVDMNKFTSKRLTYDQPVKKEYKGYPEGLLFG
ncbi:MAG: aspartate/glutamate racemase family protein [Deltaproteobacteria bacterium]|nr:aspartate/glutamate racemase family protein [Deltaproteobacteria bacterium]